ncbi:triacylglycerol lipase [Massilia sp. MP_M2]|uniref:esterase/lipase family protein n=1 Tax=Massilia sp. MP_M2 TaxID=3071713 RepID=UPI00319DADD9
MARLVHACAAALMVFVLGLLAAPAAPAANNDPVVLVHGFLGFGPDEFQGSGFNYWGGYGDIAAYMQVYRGPHAVLAAAVSPIASNWDRAAELYAQIKGGCVDYGKAHVVTQAVPGQLQKPPGKCWAADPRDNPHAYPLALYPQWDRAHPIHVIGHSQGGTTIRALIQLLEHGSMADEGDGALFKGGKTGWIRSATTISAPHNGTTLSDAVLNILPNVPIVLRDILRHRAAGWELAPDGAREFNRWALTSPDVYYFSVGTVATASGSWCCNGTDRAIAPIQTTAFQYARADMMPYFKSFAGEWIVPSAAQRGMGSYTVNVQQRVRIDSDWFPNDGVVNTVSMRAPGGHPARDYDGTALRGTWNFLGNYPGYDHFDILNWPNRGPSANPLYERISDILFAL